jgi:acyl dehydratase
VAAKLSFETVNNGGQLPEITRHITQEEMWRHAVTCFDCNPLHLNAEWNKSAKPFGLDTTVVHGNLMFCLTGSVISTWAYPVGGRLSKLEIKLIKPVPPNSTLTFGGVVTEKHPVGKGKNYVVVELYGKNQNGEEVAVSKAEVILP